MKVGYARVSTEEQHLDAQVMQLKAAGCDRIIEETASGKSTDDRDGLRSIMRLIGPGDVLMVCKLDRLARNTLDMLQLVKSITDKGAGFKSLAESWVDTTSPAGNLMLTIFAGLAQFERERMLERQKDGIARARAANKYRGRPATFDAEKARSLKKSGIGVTEIARQMKCDRETVYRALRSAPASPENNSGQSGQRERPCEHP